MSDKLFLLDGHSLAHRAFYALPLLQNDDGEYTNAVFGFARMLFRLIDDENPEYLIVAFDKKAPTFRHEEYEDYKATRKKMPDELSPQIPLIKKLLEGLKIPIIGKEGYEADDVIGTLAKIGEEKGLDVRIVTGDRDSLQLVTDKINVFYTRRGITDIVQYDLVKVREKYELEPEQLIDMKGLMGDSSDNIPGVPGIGEKTSISLLKEFSSLENILDSIDQVSGKKRKENLREYADQARMSKKLGTIITDVPLEFDFEECKMGDPDRAKLIPFLERLGFSSLLDKFKENEEIDIEKMSFREVDEQKKIEVLIEKIVKQGKMAFDLLLDDYSYPVSASVNEFLLALDNNEVYSLPFTEEILDLFSTVLENHNIKKYILHGKETQIILKGKGIEVAGFVFDPLLATYLLNPSDKLPSLEEQLKLELNLVLPADITEKRKNGLILSRLFELKEILCKKLEEKNILELYNELELPLIEVLAELELNGIKIDKEYLGVLSVKWEKELEDITAQIYQFVGEEFNINSPKQLGV
ncbi:MAG: 5'-3' exonuclease H3TH domain-containing protein, partial [Halanaerobiales bacterium]